MYFFMPMEVPTCTFQQHRVGKSKRGKVFFYDSPELADARAKLMAHLSKHRPQSPYACGIHLSVKWLFPLTGQHTDGEYKLSKPDTDNLQKLLKDCMTRCGFWTDDALVASETVEKFWANAPGIFISIYELPQNIHEEECFE